MNTSTHHRPIAGTILSDHLYLHFTDADRRHRLAAGARRRRLARRDA
ncbi:MAG: hypothetical protein ACLGHQ_12455 [Acidimicrobiia bacterium]